MNLAYDLFYQYIERIRLHDDEMGLVIKGHLLIEYVLNRIIQRELRDSRRILDNPNQYTFSVKLQILYGFRILPEEIHRNIRRVNALRNEYAHRLEPNLAKIDWLISTKAETGEIEDIEAKVKRSSARYRERKYIKVLCMTALVQLRNHYFEKYSEYASPAHGT